MSADLDRPPSGRADVASRLTPLGRTVELWLLLATRRLHHVYPRDNELLILVMSALVGSGVGLAVAVLHDALRALQAVTFGLPPGAHLSGNHGLDPTRIVLSLAIGGLIVGVSLHWIRRFRPHSVVDPIEANALYGGQMSLIDSMRLVGATFLSAGSGASVGMEAAFSQLGGSLASKAGQILRLRRKDLRLLVGCGAGAAIAAAFNAPFAGAFYAFELIIGSYAPSALAPVMVAVLSGVFTARGTLGSAPIFTASTSVSLTTRDFGLFAIMGLTAALVGVLTMRLVPFIERHSKRSWLPDPVRPAIGGLAIGLIAVRFPEVLGSGQGAIQHTLDNELPTVLLISVLAAKAVASAISVGMGFRGGLFSSSLFLGALLGSAFAAVIQGWAPTEPLDRVAYTLVGMGSLAAAIVGAPVTMILLVLELTSDFSIAIGTMIAVIIASVVVRQTFGYSFATWRFHLRGVPIRSAHDIGWLRDLTVGKLMRRDPQTASTQATLEELRRRFPLGAAKHVFLLNESGHYAGVINLSEVHDPDLDKRLDELHAKDLCHASGVFLTPHENIRTALNRFVAAETETMVVVAGPQDRRVIGYLTEAYALRRYNQELERTRSAELGDSPLFGPS